jgi:hypothetical protein
MYSCCLPPAAAQHASSQRSKRSEPVAAFSGFTAAGTAYSLRSRFLELSRLGGGSFIITSEVHWSGITTAY